MYAGSGMPEARYDSVAADPDEEEAAGLESRNGLPSSELVAGRGSPTLVGLMSEEKMPADRVGLIRGVDEKGSSNFAALDGVAKGAGDTPLGGCSRTLRGVMSSSSSDEEAEPVDRSCPSSYLGRLLILEWVKLSSPESVMPMRESPAS
jgi:hypothetical protein